MVAPQTGWGLKLRNGVSWFMCRMGPVGMVQRLFGRVFKAKEEAALSGHMSSFLEGSTDLEGLP